MTSLRDKKFLREIGLRIRALRTEKHWTQEQFAKNCGLHRTYVAAVERGERNVTVVSLRALADVLRVDITQLLS